MAVAFYAESGFCTPVPELRTNMEVLLRSSQARVAIADYHGAIVGFAITTLSFGLEQGHVAELEDLYVRPAHRRIGMAGALIDDSSMWAQSRGCRMLELVVAQHGDREAGLEEFYARRGFTNEGRRLLSRSIETTRTSAVTIPLV
ncbi:MAG: GNAT family N-acetyltransferase [Mycobacteriaceae bacterium]|nr:GNAT family N-acetyltransferase [Mycobacteriaceae bacterium]